MILLENTEGLYNYLIEMENLLEIEDKSKCRDFIISMFNIGMHIKKGLILSETIRNLTPNKPYQLFLATNTSFIKINEYEIQKCRQIVKQNNLKIFIHSPYLINLASDKKYNISCLKHHLDISVKCGFSGCVVHVGKYCKLDLVTAITNMTNNILQVLESATPECPLLLETPSGQGTEMLTNIGDFMNFIKEINDERFGICLDTCHVFSSGYLPSEYLIEMNNNTEIFKYLKLIHLNDSQGDKACCKDRHMLILDGKIPIKDLLDTIFISQQFNIPCIIE